MTSFPSVLRGRILRPIDRHDGAVTGIVGYSGAGDVVVEPRRAGTLRERRR